MSKKNGTRCRSYSTGVAALASKQQSNVCEFDDRSGKKIVPPNVTQKKQSAIHVTKIPKYSTACRSAEAGEFFHQTDLSENEPNCGRPEVLSIDSDLSSANDASDQDLTETSFRVNLKQQNITARHDSPPKPPESDRESLLKVAAADYSYCTPPRVEFQDNLGKKAEQCLPFSRHSPTNRVAASISSAFRQRVHSARLVYAPSTVDVAERALSGGGDSKLTINVELPRPSSSRPVSESAAMDMKYADLTHMQLKRSLDQIHGQQHRSSAFQEQLHFNSNVQSNVKVCYTHPLGSGSVGDYSEPLSNGFSSYGSSFPQSSKFDSILNVKDAMLQEKEAVILKLRMQVSSLQHQVQEGESTLRQVVHSQVPTSYGPTAPTSRYNDAQTRRKIFELEQLLGQCESKLNEKTSYFKSERREMETKIESLEGALKEKDSAFLDTKKRHKTTVERLEKYKKRVESLERYLGDLPTLEESNKLKTEAGILGEEREALVLDNSKLKGELDEKARAIAARDENIRSLERDKDERENRIRALEDELAKAEKSKVELGRTERDDLEDMRYEVVRYQKEREDTALVLAGCEKRMKQLQERSEQEKKELREKVTEAEAMADTVRRDLLAKQQTSNKVQTAVVSLSSQNQQLLEEKLTLQDKVQNLEKLQSNMRESSRACFRLQRETTAVVRDLQAVTQVLLQTVNGSDPNISALLGVRNDSTLYEDDFGGGATPTDEDAVEIALSPENTCKRLKDVRRLRQDIEQLRAKLSNQYADSIGDNCVTQ